MQHEVMGRDTPLSYPYIRIGDSGSYNVYLLDQYIGNCVYNKAEKKYSCLVPGRPLFLFEGTLIRAMDKMVEEAELPRQEPWTPDGVEI
jgi:hypothetical protein